MTTHHDIRARRVRFDWSQTPLHWVPDDPQTTHTINVLHLLLPAGEKWFCEVYRKALPRVTDEQLRADVKGFIGQEAIHSRAHASVLEHLTAQDLDTTPYTRRVEWMFDRLLGDRVWLTMRLAIIAAVEHFTCILGSWVIDDSHRLDELGADATMLDLLRWHGAEEVEHRSVAFDLFQDLSGSYVLRVLAMIGVFPVLMWLWLVGTRFMMRRDALARRPTLRAFVRAGRDGRLPAAGYILSSVPRYLAPRHHPSNEGSTDRALAYLATSPAARSYAV
jgi:predicted metal-dependent hydrolase